MTTGNVDNEVCEFVRQGFYEPIRGGEEYFLIADDWFTKWKDYVQYDQSGHDSNVLRTRAPHPGAIDNSSLFEAVLRTDHQGKQVPRLRNALNSDSDYVILSRAAFDKLVNAYSIKDDSHRIARKSIAVGQTMEHRVEVYEPELTILHLNDVLLSKIVNNGTTGKQLLLS